MKCPLEKSKGFSFVSKGVNWINTMHLTVTNLRDYANIIEELQMDNFEVSSFDGKILYLTKSVDEATADEIAKELYKSVDAVLNNVSDFKKGTKANRYSFHGRSNYGSYDFVADIESNQRHVNITMTIHN